MNTMWMLMMVTAAAAVVFGLLLWRLSRRAAAPDCFEEERDSAELAGLALEAFQPMSRLFAEEDFAFLAARDPQHPRLWKALRRHRRRVLRLFLQELRSEFQRVYEVCRHLAPASPDPSFGPLITRQAAAFYALFLLVDLRCALGWFLPLRVDPTGLLAPLGRLRGAAQACLAEPTSMAFR